MRPLLVYLFTLAFAATASATFSIEYPGGDDSWWVADNQNIVQWTCNDDAPASYYNIVILNNDTSLLAEASTVATNVSNWDCSELIESSQSNYTAGTGYYIELTSVDGATLRDQGIRVDVPLVERFCLCVGVQDFHFFSGLLHAYDVD
ncbi:hypothetical protein EV715DRAFT_286068 [Schizophyllum commune]